MINPKAIINLNHLKHNLKILRNVADDAELMPVIKANAYGHGMLEIANALHKEDIKTVCVATHDELMELLKSKIEIDIFHLGKISIENISSNDFNHCIFTINSIDDVLYIHKLKINKKIRCHIKVDTGLNRMGCKPKEFKNIYNYCLKSDIIKLEGIYSHLACSEDANSNHNLQQINLFSEIKHSISCKNLKFHLLNSGGLFNFPKHRFNIIRTGISIYGIMPNLNSSNKLKPIMEFKAPIVHIKKISYGEKVGYGCTYIANKNMNIAIVQCGYADGLLKCFEKGGSVFYNNLKFPIIGRISMDLFAIDCNDYNFNLNDELTIWGGEHAESKIEYLSLKYNMIPYVFLTSLSNRVERFYEIK